MLIRHKLMLSAVVSVGALVAMFVLKQYSSSTEAELSRASALVQQLENQVLTLRKHEKDFFSRLDLQYAKSHQQTFDNLTSVLHETTTLFENYDLSTVEADKFMADLSRYQQVFSNVVSLQQQIGLTPKTGLYGKLRDAVHQVESLLDKHDSEAMLVRMLQLRRNEKDFMLRRDMKYVDTFNSNYDKFTLQLAQSRLATSVQAEIMPLILRYKASFLALVAAEQQLGLNESEGMMAQLRDAIAATEASTNQLMVQANSRISDEQHATLIWGVVLFGLITLALLWGTMLIIRSIVKPVDSISKAIAEVEQHKNLSLRCEIHRQDELGQIGLHFNNMVSSFQDVISQVLSSVATMRTACDQLTHNAQQTSNGVMQQLSETDMVATAVTEMGSTVEEIARNTEHAAGRASQSHQNAMLGQQGVEQSIEQIQLLANQLNQSAQVVTELENDSHTIGNVLEVIRGIAEQTNLLALNAAIEAARAGDLGRGFAVVADEVRNLAMRTQESTEEIAGIIHTLQTRTSSIVSVMRQSQQQGDSSAAQSAKAGQLLQEITGDITDIMDMNTQIAAAVEEQSTVAAEINRNVVAIRDIAESSAQAANDNSSASEDVRKLADSLHQAVSQFRI